MNECLFEVKGEFFKGERVYGVKHWPFYHHLRSSVPLMRDFIRRMCEALTLLFRLGIVHADLKPDNILVDFDEQYQRIISLKIIDFGSAFMLKTDGRVLKD